MDLGVGPEPVPGLSVGPVDDDLVEPRMTCPLNGVEGAADALSRTERPEVEQQGPPQGGGIAVPALTGGRVTCPNGERNNLVRRLGIPLRRPPAATAGSAFAASEPACPPNSYRREFDLFFRSDYRSYY